ncbi:MAG: tetratricopeptide repeat protein [Bacteroidales bacterium]|nr:tetratricopeptide repeat protein [Bacteroidales bacterium]
MTELIQQTGAILTQAQEWLKLPGVKEPVTGFLDWMSQKVFSKSEKSKERLILIEQQQADAGTIAKLMGNLESELEDNEELQKELNEKVAAVQTELKQAGVNITKTSTITITGNHNKAYQDISNSNITDSSINQTHSGTGDNVGRDKIVTNIYVNAKDYQELETRLTALQQQKRECQARIEKYPDDESFRQDLLRVDIETEDIKSKVESFKQDVFRLYDTFTSINVNTERLRLAKAHFDKGEFREADAILKAEEMSSDLSKLKERDSQLDQEKAEVKISCEQIANEFLIKAQLWATFYTEPDWFERTVDFYEKALDAARTHAIISGYALFLKKHNKFNKAQPLYEEALQIYRAFAIEKPETYLPDLAMTLNNLANLQQAKNEFGDAMEKYQEALKIRRALATVNPGTYLPYVATTLNNLAALNYVRNEFSDSMEKYHEALQIYRGIADECPELYLNDVAMTLNNLANLQKAKNEFGDAMEKYQEALHIYRTLANENPSKYLPDLATTLHNLAVLQKDKNEFGDAQEKYHEALQIFRVFSKEDPKAYLPDVSMTLINLSIFYLKSVPDKTKSIALALETLAIAKQFPENLLVQQDAKQAIQVLQENGLDIDKLTNNE